MMREGTPALMQLQRKSETREAVKPLVRFLKVHLLTRQLTVCSRASLKTTLVGIRRVGPYETRWTDCVLEGC